MVLVKPILLCLDLDYSSYVDEAEAEMVANKNIFIGLALLL